MEAKEKAHKQVARIVNKKMVSLAIALSFALSGMALAYRSIDQLSSKLHLQAAVLPTLQDCARGVQFYDRNDHYLCTVRADRDRQPVPLSKVSPNMRNALVAAEDHNFFRHHGIDFVAVVRALNANRQAGHIVEGGSTVTQQLVRNLYLDKTDKTYSRKVKEVLLAWDAENRYSKPKILETYLNEVYFGGGVYGIERAANNYFDHHASSLSVPESAFLAGIIRCPSVYAQNRHLALKRQSTVLDKMAQYGYITEAQAAQFKTEKLVFQEGSSPVKYPYYITYATELVHKQLGDDMWRQNVKVYTNLDPAAQTAAVAVLHRDFKKAPKGINQGALVSMSVKDGAVLALVGGVGEYSDNQWNRALHPHTAGSAFKPFVYLTGLIKGVLKPDSLINDANLADDDANANAENVYAPKNFDGKYRGWITVRDALTQSRNVCAVRIATACGINDVIDTAREAGIASPLDPYPSLALGACAVTPLEMATAYGTLARGGAYMPAQLIRSIKTEDGTAYTLTASASTNLPAENVKQLVDLMQDVVNYGTGAQAHLAGIPAAGKTGTADQGRDIWFVGFTPDTVTAVWGGSDKNLPVRGNSVTGGAVMAHMWHDYMTSFYAQRRPARGLAFAQPSQALLKTMPKYDDVTLLTADASQQIPQPATGTSAHGAIVDARQASANIPTVIQNARNAITGGIGSAFFVQGLTAAQRWQTAASKIALSQPSEQTGTATNPALQPQPVSAQASDSTSVQQGQAAQQGTTVQLTDNTANAKQATEPVSAPADSPPLDAAAQLRKYQVASQRATGSM